MRFRFADLEVDSARLTVERDGEAVGVQPQVFDVLCYLVEHRDRVVPKTELLDQVWGDRFVSESALSSRIKSVRQLVGDDGARQSVVKTTHGRGFRWVADVEVLDADPAEVESADPERPATASPVRPTPPPGPHTETLGRDEIVDQVAASVAVRRMVSLVGPPGIGKTRVALEVLRAVHEGGRDVSFVELHTATGRDDILRLVRQGVGLDRGAAATMEPSGDDLERWLLERLAGTKILLALDNCEHVARDVASFASSLLTAAPEATILATSRRTLWVDGEQLVVVRPLGQPDEEPTWDDLGSSAATRLFVERSTAAGAAWRCLDEEAGLIHRVCRRLDGVPLAIELAAARMRWMSIERLLADLTDPPNERGSGGDPLTTSMRASRMLLDEAGRASFDALSIFAGTFPLDAALAVVSAVRPEDDPLAVFQQLVDHSLIDVVDRSANRYRLLAPVRQFAASGDARTVTAGRAVLAYYADLVERTWPAGSTAPARGWDELDADIGDIVNLVERACTIDAAGGRRLVGSLGLFWSTGDSTQQCMTICEQLGEPTDDDPAAAARYLLTWSMCSSLLWQPMPERARRAHQLAIETEQWSVAAAALSLVVAGDHVWAELDAVDAVWDDIESLYRRADDVAGEAWALVSVLGHAQACAGRSTDAASSFRTAIELYERIGDGVGVAIAAVRLAREAIWLGTDADLAEEALALIPDDLGESSDPSLSAPHGLLTEATWYAGRVAEARGDIEAALDGHRRALAISEAHVPGTIMTNTMRVHLAGALRRAGKFPEAAACLRDAAATVLRSVARARWAHSTWVLESTAGLLAEMARSEDAATLFGAAESGRERLDAAMPTWDRPGYARDVATLPRSPSVSTAWAAGRRLDLERACRLAMSVCDAVRAPRGPIRGRDQ